MTRATATPSWSAFEQSRGRLFRIALRMLGSTADAEDMVQETSLRWIEDAPEALRVPEAWLVTVVTRLSIDRLRRRAQRPPNDGEDDALHRAATDGMARPDSTLERHADLSTAFVALREQLEPVARSAFVLREAFGCDYAEIARLLARSAANCRQMVRRARERVRRDLSGSEPRGEVARACAERFLTALSSNDREAALALLNDASA